MNEEKIFCKYCRRDLLELDFSGVDKSDFYIYIIQTCLDCNKIHLDALEKVINDYKEHKKDCPNCNKILLLADKVINNV